MALKWRKFHLRIRQLNFINYRGRIWLTILKKEEKQFYRSGKKPELVDVPQMQYLAVQGQGDPNQEGGEYK